ncbi:DUF3558 family protein [Actinophytocola sp.]|jgi:hypothetical protein|uniref:DUF3558 family protein n=1 Tax=Actinophytocola sp. TaxID=1872138 RepID=UPI002EDA04C6
MPRPALALPVLILVTAVSMASCTGTDAPPTPSTTSTTTTESTLRPSVPPEAAQPVDLRPHRLQPCALLSKDQVTELDLPPQTSEGANTESGICEWFTNQSAPGRTETYLFRLEIILSGDPLAEVYRESNDLNATTKDLIWQVFEERTIRGLPAALRSRFDPAASCEVVVGAGSTQGISMSASTGGSDPELCQRMVTAAEWVVDAARA